MTFHFLLPSKIIPPLFQLQGLLHPHFLNKLAFHQLFQPDKKALHEKPLLLSPQFHLLFEQHLTL